MHAGELRLLGRPNTARPRTRTTTQRRTGYYLFLSKSPVTLTNAQSQDKSPLTPTEAYVCRARTRSEQVATCMVLLLVPVLLPLQMALKSSRLAAAREAARSARELHSGPAAQSSQTFRASIFGGCVCVWPLLARCARVSLV